jgi:tetratricopeptide (TPR) repeat protein
MIKTLNNLAEISAQSGKPAEAAPLYRQAIEYADRKLGPQHPVLGDILFNYANFLRRTKNGREARKIEKRANAIRERTRHENLEGYTVEASSLVNPNQTGKASAMALKP